MKSIPLLAALFALPLLAEGPPAPPSPLEACLPGSAAAVLVVRDVPCLASAWERTSFPDVLGQAKGALRMVGGMGEEETEVADLLQALKPALKGQLALGVVGAEEIGVQIRSLYDAPSGKTPVDALLLAEVVPEAFQVLEGLALRKLPKTVVVSKEDFEGGTLRVLKDPGEPQSAAWALVSGRLALAFGDEPVPLLQRAVQALKRGRSESSLADNPRFQEVSRRVPQAQVLCFLDLEALASQASKALAQVSDLPEGKRDRDVPPPAGLAKALALDSLRSGYAALSPAKGGGGAVDLDLGLLYGRPDGFLRVLTLSPGPCPRPSFLPPDAAWLGADRLSYGDLLAAVEAVAQDLGPKAQAGFAAWLAEFNKDAGLDLKAVLGSLGDETAWAGFPRRDPKQILPYGLLEAVSVKDPQVFSKALDVFREKMIQGMERMDEMRKEQGMPPPAQPPYTHKDILGATLHSFTQDGGMGISFQYHYALAGNWLLVCIGEPGPLEDAVRRILKPGASPWDRPEVKADLQALPDDGAGSLGWGNPAASSLGISLSTALVPMQMMMAMGGGGGPAMPSPEDLAKRCGRAACSGTSQPGAYALRIRWFPPPALPPKP